MVQAPPNPTLEGEDVIVKATKPGLYGKGKTLTRHWPKDAIHGSRPNAGASFALDRPEDFSPNWMEVVQANPEELKLVERLTKEAKAKAEERELVETGKKKRG